MIRTDQQLRDDAIAIWRAAIDAVRSDRLVRDVVRCDGRELVLGDVRLDFSRIRRIAVIGAGKAGAGMAAGFEAAIGSARMAQKQLVGWLNVPADCVRPLQRIQLHAARPAGVNEPTAEGVAGTEKILEIARQLGPDDLCVCLLSGGGSALLPAPVAGITLADKQAITRLLSAAGANIQQLNTVRTQLSRIKGGGLARSCGAGRLVTLIISDVIGDPLDVIASGPTVADRTTASDALAVLNELGVADAPEVAVVRAHLQRVVEEGGGASVGEPGARPFLPVVDNRVIGNNALAVDAAGSEAERRGYRHAMHAARELEGPAEEVGRHLAEMAADMVDGRSGPDCLITGGEPTVKLVDASRRGMGGRNQQLVLAALLRLVELRARRSNPLESIALLSGGTDGEDGPTDAAGAVITAELVARWGIVKSDATDFLRRNDAYRFFEPLGGLLRTGPTHTNVCDVRVVVTQHP